MLASEPASKLHRCLAIFFLQEKSFAIRGKAKSFVISLELIFNYECFLVLELGLEFKQMVEGIFDVDMCGFHVVQRSLHKTIDFQLSRYEHFFTAENMFTSLTPSVRKNPSHCSFYAITGY